jgi:hypothetical protein
MSENFRGLSIVREIRQLLIKHGFDEVQADLIIDKLRSELTETADASSSEDTRLAISRRLAHVITTMEVGNNATPKSFKDRYDHNYLIIIGILSAAIYDGLCRFVQFVLTEIKADTNTESLSERGIADIPRGKFDRAIEDVDEAEHARFNQQGSKLVGTGVVGNARQGLSVALSMDGNTAIVGGVQDDSGVGAAWVFTRESGVWSQQAKLVGTGVVGFPWQGLSVGLSGDGDTAIVGGPADNALVGAAWVFTRSAGVWSQQGPKLVGTSVGGVPTQGWSVALSADGNTAIVGGPGEEAIGAMWVFTRSAGIWSQQGPKLVGAGAVGPFGANGQGFSVSLSADGNTAIVGGPNDNGTLGAAWVFTRSDGVWGQQGPKLVGTGAVGVAGQGYSVSLSADGNTAIVGGFQDNGKVGAAWVFTRSGGVWSQLGSKLVGTGEIAPAAQGESVSLSGDGNTAIVGGYQDNNGIGAAWVYTQPVFAGTP